MPSHRSSKTRLLQILFASGGYAQLRFEDGTLSPGNPLAYSDPLRCMEPGEPGYGDCLVALIGQEAIREFQDDDLKVRFEGDVQLSVHHWVNGVLAGWHWSGTASVVDI